MADDIVTELGDLHRDAVRLQGLIAAAVASAPPRAEGSDATGMIRATIGGDGLPAGIAVQDGWHRRLSGERFGTAVIEAFSAATQRRIAAWNDALQANGWLSRVDSVRNGRGGPVQDTATTLPDPGPEPPPVDEMVSDLISAFDGLGELSAAVTITAEGSGTSEERKVVVRLSKAGLVSCVVDGRWASQQNGGVMARAFAEALARAKVDLAARADAPGPAGKLDRVLAEALALLHDPPET